MTPGTAAQFALVAISLIAMGALLTGDVQNFSIAERGTVLGGIVAVLGAVAYFGHRRGGGGNNV